MLKRNLWIKPRNETIEELYQRATEGIRHSIGLWSQLPLGENQVGQWETETASAILTEWINETTKNQSLWEGIITGIRTDDRLLERRFIVGYSNRDLLIVREEWEISPPHARVNASIIPDVYHWIGTNDNCVSIDKRPVYTPLSLRPENIFEFVQFLSSEKRKLPILLITHTAEVSLEKIHNFAKGLCHVVKISSQEVHTLWEAAMPSHTCYAGSVRLYYPNFEKNDNAWDHPFWRSNIIRQEPDRVLNEIFSHVASWSLRVHNDNPLRTLLRARSENERVRLQNQWRDTISASQATVSEKADLEALLITFIDENESLWAENNRLRDESRRRNDEIRHLRYQLNQQWDIEESVETEADEACLYVSEQVDFKLSEMDVTEFDYWCKHFLPKLTNPEHRNANSEFMMRTESVSLYVFPRRKNADGRRAIYRADEKNVYLYEYFSLGEHDIYETYYQKKKNLDDYKFERWEE